MNVTQKQQSSVAQKCNGSLDCLIGADLFTCKRLLFLKKNNFLYIFMSNCNVAMFLPLLFRKKQKKLLSLHFKIICSFILKLFLTFPSLIFPLSYFFIFIFLNLPSPLADNHPIPKSQHFYFLFFFFFFLLFNILLIFPFSSSSICLLPLLFEEYIFICIYHI
jgi:hypothetical protein